MEPTSTHTNGTVGCECFLRSRLGDASPLIAGRAPGVVSSARKRAADLKAALSGLFILLAGLVFSPTVVAQDPAPASPPPAGGPGVAVDRFEFTYGLAHPDLPPLDELKNLTVKSTRDGNVFRAPAASGAENLTLSGIPEGSQFDGDALRGIAQDVVRWYNNRGLYGVWVSYSDLESSAAGVVDNRPADSRTAHLVIWASQIAEVRTLARGKRIKSQFSINNSKHRRIISKSPLHPGATADDPGSLFNEEVLNEYLRGLSLHPGRRVEASIASAGQPGKVVLDYLVTESKAWQIFTQVNNFGTEATGVIRGRLGYQDNQLTNHDDVFNIDLISTPDFETYGSFISYRIPVIRPATLLARVYASYGDFLATDATLDNLRFAGQNWLVGTEFTNRLMLGHDWQLQSVAGVNFTHYGIRQLFSETQLTDAYSDFMVPFIGTTVSRDFYWGSLSGGLRIDHTLDGFANTDASTGIPTLGRIGADTNWTSLRWNLSAAAFLEPLFHRTDRAQALAHEVSARVKGRFLLRGERLIPQEEEPLGGALSVRGYPESIISADEFYAATIEYAYHIPRKLKPAEPGTLFRRPFKWRPTQVGQIPDWDLTVRGFFDYAYRIVTPPAAAAGTPPSTGTKPLSETNLSLAGAGVGVALTIKQNFSLRCDFGTALTEVVDPSLFEDEQIKVAKGNKQVYLVTSFAW